MFTTNIVLGNPGVTELSDNLLIMVLHIFLVYETWKNNESSSASISIYIHMKQKMAWNAAEQHVT